MTQTILKKIISMQPITELWWIAILLSLMRTSMIYLRCLDGSCTIKDRKSNNVQFLNRCFEWLIIINPKYLEQNPNSKRIRLDESEVKVFEQFQKEKIYYKQFIEGYYSRFLKNLADYRQCLCHQDLHGLNLIMDDAREKVTGVIDFGWTMKYSYFFSEFNMIFMIQLNSMPDGITGE